MENLISKIAFISYLSIAGLLLIPCVNLTYQIYEWLKQGNRLGINVTDSERLGFYRCSPLLAKPKLNEMIGFVLPSIQWIRKRHYLHDDQLLIKHVGAVPGEYLFTQKNKIYACKNKNYSADCRMLGECLLSDHKGRSLACAKWQAYQIPENNYYLKATRDPYSLDSRYFGLIPLSNIKYRAFWLFPFPFIYSGDEQ